MPTRVLQVSLLACAALLTAPAAYAVDDCVLDGQSVNPANGNTTAGKSGLMQCTDRDTGLRVREQELRDGKFMGVRRNYRNGKLVLEANINERGNRDGRVREFAETGQVLRDETYRNGTSTGVGLSYFPSGQVRRVTAYNEQGREQAYAEYTSQGKLKGLRCAEQAVMGRALDDRALCGHAGKPSVVEMYAEQGHLASRATFVAGKRTVLDSFWPDGTLGAHEEVGPAGRLERGFSRTGVKVREESWEMSGTYFVKQSELKYDEQSGTLLSEKRWSKNEPVSEAAYYLNGRPRRTVAFRHEGDATRIEAKDFYDNGRVAAEGRFISPDGSSAQVPVGDRKRYDEAGRLREQATFGDGGKIRHLKVWDESGAVTRDDEVFEDGSRKY